MLKKKELKKFKIIYNTNKNFEIINSFPGIELSNTLIIFIKSVNSFPNNFIDQFDSGQTICYSQTLSKQFRSFINENMLQKFMINNGRGFIPILDPSYDSSFNILFQDN